MKRPLQEKFEQLTAAYTIAPVVFVLMAGMIGGNIVAPSMVRAQQTGSVSNPLQKPVVPAKSIYLGAWVLPDGHPAGGSTPTDREILSLPAFQKAIDSNLAIVHVYTKSWDAPVEMTSLHEIAKSGAVPLIDWRCTSESAVISGADDALITTYAQTLKAFGKPVFLRWFWGMNIADRGNANCVTVDAAHPDAAANYVSAWKHVWKVFHAVGAANVAFVWCPALPKPETSDAYYPGDEYVDWIAINGYDRKGDKTFGDIFSGFYRYMTATHKRPIMIAEAGTLSFDQAAYLQDVQKVLPVEFPEVKAFLYYDGKEAPGDWTLAGDGLEAFKVLAKDPYFSFKSPQLK